MTSAVKTLAQLKKASKLTNRAFHKNGPKSYKKGQGALLKVLHKKGVATTAELVETLSYDRRELKDIVRKAERNGYVTVEDAEGKRGYAVKLTEAGEELAEKRCAVQSQTADDILSALSDEEVAQLNALTEKIILSCKENGAHGSRKHGKKRHHGRKHCCR